jgi:hypothetical protein
MKHSRVILLCMLLGVYGCDSGGGGASPADAAVDLCAASKFAELSQPCCVDNSVDACGGGLFCAALDGRTQAVCYLEYSRPDLTECTEDRQCVSRSCNPEESKCRSTPAAICDQAVGCAPVAEVRFVCDVAASMCLPVGDGAPGSLCENDVDCDADSPACDTVTHRCERWPIKAEQIDSFAATDISLSLHESGRPFVAMNNPGADMVQLALRQESEWQRVDYPREASGPAAIAGPGSQAYLCMAWQRDASGPPDLIFEITSSFQVDDYQVEFDIEVGASYATSIAQAADGTLHVSYRDGERLVHAFGSIGNFFDGGNAEVDTLLGSEGHRTSVAVYEDEPAIAYNDLAQVRFARWSNFSSTWSIEVVGPGRSASLAFDGIGVPHVSFFDPEDASIRHAARIDGAWVVEDIVTKGAAERSNLVVDGNDVVHVTFHDAESRALVYARRDEAGWVSGHVDTGGPVGPHSALMVDAAGLVHLVFVDETAGETKYATIERP